MTISLLTSFGVLWCDFPFDLLEMFSCIVLSLDIVDYDSFTCVCLHRAFTFT